MTRLLPWILALGVVLLSAAPRWVLHDRTPTVNGDSWTVSDPDSLYHARRVERALLNDFEVANEDPLLNAPDGARIPWPPYYDWLAARLIAPWLEEPGATDQGWKSDIERATATLPWLFGILTSLMVFLAARSLCGNLAGVLAALLHALCLGSITYSRVGNGDHHAFVTLSTAALLWGLSSWLVRSTDRGAEPTQPGTKSTWLLGATLGVIAGLALGSWVASLLTVLIIDGLFACLLFVHAKRPIRGLAAFGASFHGAALLILTPAILQSPWKEEFPWMVVNLSWFHLAYLLTGTLVFLPLLLSSKRQSSWQRFYPWAVGAVLAVIAGLSFALNLGPAAGIREGFEWVSRQDTFMGAVAESRPLIGEASVAGELTLYLGWHVFLLPLVGLAALVVIIKRGRLDLLPWLLALVVFALQAAGQARFADVLSVPLAVLCGWALATSIQRLPSRKLVLGAGAALILLAPLAQLQTLTQWSRAGEEGPRPDWRKERGARELLVWIAENASETSPGSVLSNWNRGHEIEWVTGRGSVATNFGSYVGEEGFLAPGRFFLSEDDEQAELILKSRDARFVVHSCFLSSALPGWLLAGDPGWKNRYLDQDASGGGRLLPAWSRTVGSRLLGADRSPQAAPRPSLDFLRLVHASPIKIRRSPLAGARGPVPYGWVWERVEGARVELAGEPGMTASVAITIEYRSAAKELLERIHFQRNATVESDGFARLRVPYATLERNGDGEVSAANWRVGERRGSLSITGEQVLEGLKVSATD